MSRKTSLSLQATPRNQNRLNIDRRMLSAIVLGLLPALALILKHYA